MRNRRFFIKSLSLPTRATFLSIELPASKSKDTDIRIGYQQYSWFTNYKMEGKNWMENVNTSLNDTFISSSKFEQEMINYSGIILITIPGLSVLT